MVGRRTNAQSCAGIRDPANIVVTWTMTNMAPQRKTQIIIDIIFIGTHLHSVHGTCDTTHPPLYRQVITIKQTNSMISSIISSYCQGALKSPQITQSRRKCCRTITIEVLNEFFFFFFAAYIFHISLSLSTTAPLPILVIDTDTVA